jgi:hypothetical protein
MELAVAGDMPAGQSSASTSSSRGRRRGGCGGDRNLLPPSPSWSTSRHLLGVHLDRRPATLGKTVGRIGTQDHRIRRPEVWGRPAGYQVAPPDRTRLPLRRRRIRVAAGYRRGRVQRPVHDRRHAQLASPRGPRPARSAVRCGPPPGASPPAGSRPPIGPARLGWVAQASSSATDRPGCALGALGWHAGHPARPGMAMPMAATTQPGRPVRTSIGQHQAPTPGSSCVVVRRHGRVARARSGDEAAVGAAVVHDPKHPLG